MINFLTQAPMWVVFVTSLLIWVGVAIFIQRVDSRLRALERKGPQQ